MNRAAVFATALLLAACGSKTKPAEPAAKEDAGRHLAADDAAPTVLQPAPPLPAVPAGLPAIELPATVTPEAVALGELLFWDTRLSINNKLACASCHDPAHGFAGGKRADTAAGKPNLRRAPALVNLAWHTEFGWDGRYQGIADQLASHARGQLGDELAAAVGRIGELPGYRAQFARMGGAPSAEAATAALGAYVLTRYAGDAPWDRLERSADAPADVKAGYQLFQTKAQCSVCHTPPLYTDLRYHRIGLIASPDEGRGRLDPARQGAFKTPSLRDAATREGFFHDASAETLDVAIDWHLAGGTGQGADPTIIDPPVKKLTLTATERAQLGAFVRALTDLSNRSAPSKPALP
ncbi:MAG: Cytochrome-c peroxidase [Deltaproteobacteria bacterium]|nr:Cytochrome-c peroxidase [Deltaproteobacteria bacterium]